MVPDTVRYNVEIVAALKFQFFVGLGHSHNEKIIFPTKKI